MIAHIERLASDSAYRAQRREYLCEGEKLLTEARGAGIPVTAAVFHESAAANAHTEGIGRAICVPGTLFERISTLKNASGVLFSCQMPEKPAFSAVRGQVVCLDGVQDPGNVGTILRTADAFGADAVFMVGACADPYHPRTVRAAMGSLFRVPVIRADAAAFLREMDAAGIPVYAASLGENARDVREVSLSRAAVVIGNEGAGVSAYLLDSAQERVVIPMRGVAESLNAAIAAGIVLWLMQTAKTH